MPIPASSSLPVLHFSSPAFRRLYWLVKETLLSAIICRDKRQQLAKDLHSLSLGKQGSCHQVQCSLARDRIDLRSSRLNQATTRMRLDPTLIPISESSPSEVRIKPLTTGLRSVTAAMYPVFAQKGQGSG